MINVANLVELAQACRNAPWRTWAFLETGGVLVRTSHTPPGAANPLENVTLIGWREFDRLEGPKRILEDHFEVMRRALEAHAGTLKAELQMTSIKTFMREDIADAQD
jgi:hypothetical protein